MQLYELSEDEAPFTLDRTVIMRGAWLDVSCERCGWVTRHIQRGDWR